jgi:hypothetical protein
VELEASESRPSKRRRLADVWKRELDSHSDFLPSKMQMFDKFGSPLRMDIGGVCQDGGLLILAYACELKEL